MSENTQDPDQAAGEPAAYISRHGRFIATVRPLTPGDADSEESDKIARIALNAVDPVAEALLDTDGRRERLEGVVADLQSGMIQPVDHATATERIRQSIAEGEQAMASGTPMVTLDATEALTEYLDRHEPAIGEAAITELEK